MEIEITSPAPGEAATASRPPLGTVVVPAYDERESVEGLLEEIEAACGATGEPWEILFVDDGSTDGTAETLEALIPSRPALRLVRLRRNFGKSAALSAGFELARGEVVVTLDADGQDDPAEIPRLIAPILAGEQDLVSGWKRERRDPAEKRLPSRLFNRVTARLSGVPLHDFNCGLKAYRGSCARSLELYGEQHRLIPVIGFQRGWRVAELPVNHRERRHGRSKFGVERYLRGFLDLVTVLFMGRYQYRPLHLFGPLGLACMLVGIVISAWLTIEWIGGEALSRRPLLILGVLLIVVGVQLLTFGLMSEMIAASRQDARGRQVRTLQVERVVASDAGERPASAELPEPATTDAAGGEIRSDS